MPGLHYTTEELTYTLFAPSRHTHFPLHPLSAMTEYMETDAAAGEQQGDSKKISFRFCREW